MAKLMAVVVLFVAVGHTFYSLFVFKPYYSIDHYPGELFIDVFDFSWLQYALDLANRFVSNF